MTLKRAAYRNLQKWKQAPNRKPLLIRGARQVGKTTLVRDFSKEFTHYVELNLERQADRRFFDIEDTTRLLNAIFLSKKVSPANESILLFIDEIQECPQAIRQLRYLYEERPALFVIAAGSLLEFALGDISSFPVGRIDYLFLYPLNFPEYLEAIDHQQALELLHTIPIPDYAHEIMLGLFHEYALIGGMPGIVYEYIQTNDIAALSSNYFKLWQAYQDDVEKYARNDMEKRVIRHVIQTAPSEVDRIKFEGFGHSNYRSREVGEAIRSLDQAKIIQLIYPSNSLKLPLVTDYKKRPRLQFLDTGLLNHAMGLQAELIQINEMDDFYRGRIIQHLIYQELISIHEQSAFKPHFWVRQEKDSNSEVDILLPFRTHLLPVEVKAGSSGTLKSLHQFLERADHPYAIRCFSGKFGVEKAKTISGKPYFLMNMPYYLGTKMPEYAQYFLENFRL